MSTFNNFFKEAVKPENKQGLPIVTAEIGDAWICAHAAPSVQLQAEVAFDLLTPVRSYCVCFADGVPSDPLKCAQFRAAGRVRDECVASGECDRGSAAMKTFDRMLVKVPEHTWGLAQSWFIPDCTLEPI